ncbi:MAG: guanylate kinase [Bacteroidales bacterium]|nr:guanylate kinase [Bacteroidales bacterium]
MKGKVIIVSAPSGAGKTSIVKHVLDNLPELRFSTSATTRTMREGEINGRDYHFLSVDDFKKGIKRNDFLEWEEVYANQFYGTLKSEIQRIWDEGKTVIFDVDVKGGLNIKKYFGDNALAIFVEPPTVQELENRLRKRGTETEESLRKRVEKAEYELSFAPQFDKVILNDNLDDARAEMLQTIREFLNAK